MERALVILAIVTAVVWYAAWTVFEQQREDFIEAHTEASLDNIGRAATPQGAAPLPQPDFVEERPFIASGLVALAVAVVGVIIVLLVSINAELNNQKRRR